MFDRSRIWILALVIGLTAGCAYFNMLYNAKQKYKDAQKLPVSQTGEPTRQHIDTYEAAIEKCQTMIATYPDSRWIDDAMLLIARCRFGQQRYGAAIEQLDSLEARFPNTDLLEEVRFLRGRSYAENDNPEATVATFMEFVDTYDDSDHEAQALYYLTTRAMLMDDQETALKYLDRLSARHEKSRFKIEAEVEIARTLVEKERYQEGLEIYESLLERRVPKSFRFQVYIGQARAYAGLERWSEALSALQQTQDLALEPDEQAAKMLLKATAFVGVDSVSRAVNVYKNVSARFPRSKYSAESHYRLGTVYQERLDSLEIARDQYDKVPREYAKSDFAPEAIRRSSNISTLIRLRDTAGDESPEAKAHRQMSLAELQLFQFEEPEKALETYQNLLAEYPQSEVAPRAAFAIGHIYGVVLGDSAKAREMYLRLTREYAGTQQAAYADLFYPPAEVERKAARIEAGVDGVPGAFASRPDSMMVARSDSTSVRPDTTAAKRDSTVAAPGGVAPADPNAKPPQRPAAKKKKKGPSPATAKPDDPPNQNSDAKKDSTGETEGDSR